MTSRHPLINLGEVISQRKEFVYIDDLTEYKRCRVQLHAQGIVERDRVLGMEVKTKRQQVCKAEEFLVAEIDAKVGGFGIVPPELHGAIVSSHYFLFEIDEQKLDPRYLDFYSRTSSFREQVSAQGSTNYAAIRPHHVLEYTIPLPPLDEQRRLVARIEELSAKIDEAQFLRQQVIGELEALRNGLFSLMGDCVWPRLTIEDLVGRANLKNGRSVKSTDMPSDVRCLTLSSMRHGRVNCDYTKPVPLTLNEAQPYIVNANDVYIVRGNGSKHLVGRAGIVDSSPSGVIFPDLFIRVPIDTSAILPKYFVAAWNSKALRDSLEATATTTAGIWKINQQHIAVQSIPVPGIKDQQRLVAGLDRIDNLLSYASKPAEQSRVELASLLPSILNAAFNGDL